MFYSHAWGDDNLKILPGPRLSNPEENLKKAKEIIENIPAAVWDALKSASEIAGTAIIKTPENLWNALTQVWE